MKCPQCSYPNPTGATHCNMCQEVFNKSAADRYLHAQKRARRDRENGEETSASAPSSTNGATHPPAASFDVSPRILQESGPGIAWSTQLKTAAETMKRFVRAHLKVLGQAAALIVTGFLFLRFTSPDTRLQLFGGRLEYAFPANFSQSYLVTHRTEVKSWSEIEGRLDTPLPPVQRDEIGSLFLKASAPKKRAQYVVLQPKEWIVTRSGAMTQNIPTTHPSLKPVQATLKYRGTVLQRSGSSATRLGRAAIFLLPRWPSGNRRPGDTWEEPVEWVDALGDWSIHWKGKIAWELVNREMREGAPCFRLMYRVDVRPSFRDVPSWAKGALGKPSFKGTASGDAFYEVRRRRLLSNDFDQVGTLRFSINNVYRIPPEMRVGRSPRKRWGRAAPVVPGELILQIKNKFGIRKS